MVRNRKGLAPWSLAREAGIESATVDGTIEVPQYVQPVLDTGFVDEKGDWKGAKSSDKDFIALHTDLGIANGASFQTPDINEDGTWPLDMTGYQDIFLAVKPTNGGNYGIQAIMGPSATGLRFANLEPIDAAAVLRGNYKEDATFADLLNDSAEAMTADVWNILKVNEGKLAGQKLLQFNITNSSGGSSDIETAFMRIV